MQRTSVRRAWRVGVGVCLVSALAVTVTGLVGPRDAEARSRAPRAAATSDENAKPRAASKTPKAAGKSEETKSTTESPEGSTATLPKGPVFLHDQKGNPNVLVYPPKQVDEKRPVAVMLHGMCDEPEYECPHFASSMTEHAWLVCPRANLRCEGGGSIWSADRRFSKTVEEGISLVENEYPDSVETRTGRTLVGFSLGAIRGMDVAHSAGGKYRGVILIGAKIYPDAKRLRAQGVQRIVLAAGEHDMMKWHMVNETKKLVRQGFPAAFMSMGKIGHAFPSDLSERMQRALAWVNGDDSAFVPKERGEIAYAGEPAAPEG